MVSSALFLLDQVGAACGLELADRVFALLDHFVDDRGDRRRRRASMRSSTSALDLGDQQADRAETPVSLGAHGGLHVVVDLFLETHYSPECVAM